MFGSRLLYNLVTAFFTLFIFNVKVISQCPPNIGFEDGSFTNWQCFSGSVDSIGTDHVLPVSPITNKHVILQNTYPQAHDFYGGFPVNCPNGSAFSIKLGNDQINSEADRISYTFTIPAGQNIYSIIYNYAVVLQTPNHKPEQQPRFTAKVFDVVSNQYITCSSFDYSASSNLPGFKQSVVRPDVYYKTWSPVTIKLLGYGGKTVRVEFTAHDCTLGGHFGYAYLDINEDCTTPVKGNVFCLGAQSAKLQAPYGFKEYHWYNSNFSTLLGSSSILNFNPPPAAGTVFALEVIPYPGSGCTDTLYTTVRYAPVPFTLKVSDSIGTCAPLFPDLTLPFIKSGSTPGLTYSYYEDSELVEYAPTPQIIDKEGIYYIKAVNSIGCIDAKPVKVVISGQPDITFISPPVAYYPDKINITNPALILNTGGALIYTYWRDAAATINLPNPEAIQAAGTYFIKSTNAFGCSIVKPITVLIVPPPPPNAISPNGDGINDVWRITGIENYLQCKVDIFNRYGQIVFHSTGYSKPWDGKENGKPLPIGTYYYIIQFSDQIKPVMGSVTIIR